MPHAGNILRCPSTRTEGSGRVRNVRRSLAMLGAGLGICSSSFKYTSPQKTSRNLSPLLVGSPSRSQGTQNFVATQAHLGPYLKKPSTASVSIPAARLMSRTCPRHKVMHPQMASDCSLQRPQKGVSAPCRRTRNNKAHQGHTILQPSKGLVSSPPFLSP